MQHCTGPPDEVDREQPSLFPHNQDDLISNGLQALLPAGAAPVYPPGPHCNARGLTSLGEHVVRRMIGKGMIVDPDHLGVVARKRVMSILEDARYSGVISSHGWSTPDVVPRIYKLGGIVTPYADHNLGVMAKDAFLGTTLERLAEVTRDSPRADMFRIEPIALDEAAARIAQAVDRTDHALEPPVAEGYWELRALIGARLRALPGGGAAPERPELPFEERDTVVEAFLASPEGSALADAEWTDEVASHAVDFCCDYVDGRPLRWSPVVVELFMHWLPAKVLAPRAMFERVPGVLAVWIRYCGRVREVPEKAVEETVASIDRWVEGMLAGAGDTASLSPAKALGAAMERARLDIEDPAAVDAFVHRWNEARDEP